jgi:hypothetical protein
MKLQPLEFSYFEEYAFYVDCDVFECMATCRFVLKQYRSSKLATVFFYFFRFLKLQKRHNLPAA